MKMARRDETARLPAPISWPEGIRVLHETGPTSGRVGEAAIAEAPAREYHFSHPTATLLLFNLNGTARAEWTRGTRLTRFSTSPGHFTIVPAGEQSACGIDRPVQALVLSFYADRVRSLAEREWQSCTSTIEFAAVYHRNTPEIVGPLQAFADLLRARGIA